MPWWKNANICFNILRIFWNLGSQLSLHKNVSHFIGTLPGRAVTLRWQVSCLTALHLLSPSPHDGVLLNNLVVLLWILELWHFIHTDTRHVLTGHYAARHVLSSLMPDILSFKEHDSLNSRFTKFYSVLWPTLRRFGRGCTLRLSRLMSRLSCWLSCFVLGRSWFQISVGVVCSFSLRYLRFCRRRGLRLWSCESWHLAARYLPTDVSGDTPLPSSEYKIETEGSRFLSS
jgi:hypothetical protein